MEDHVVAYGNYMPHGMCLLWEPWLVLLWAGSDLLIFLSYIAIPVALFLVLRRRSEVPQVRLVILFAAFILLCGITHLYMIVTLWVPIYPFVAVWKLATGIVSMATAVMLFRLVPDLIRLPSPAQLQGEIAAHQATLASLDRQVRERTAELEAATTALAVQAREAVHRSSNLLAVVHTLALQSGKGAAREAGGVEGFLAAFLGRLRALADATRAIASEEQSAAPLVRVVDAGLAVLRTTFGAQVTATGPALQVNPTAAQHLSLALHELATNTLKYGIGAGEQVKVTVHWAVEGDSFTFTWREHPVSMRGVDGRTPEGFGTTLLTTIVPATLGGTAVREIGEGALAYRLTVPLSAITDRPRPVEDPRLAARIIATSFGA